MADNLITEPPEPTLDIDRHLKYWKMCLQAPLPNHYLPNEGVRMTLVYFIVNSIRILEGGTSSTPEKKRPPLIPPQDHRRLRQWILSHQQPGGGFVPSSTLLYPSQGYQAWEAESGAEEREGAGLANLPATLFALQLLALLADDDDADNGGAKSAFDGVDRAQTLRWLRRLQRPDGSFGEVLKLLPGKGWFVGGGYDMRYCYIAASVRWMLRGDVKEGEEGWVEDIDTQALTRYILGSQTYDGGFAGSSQEEPHAGYAYCAIAALSLLDRPLTNSTAFHPNAILRSGIRNMPGLIHWLASRQFVYLEPPPRPREDDGDDEDEDEDNFVLPANPADLANAPAPALRHVACNGRCNKVADTCYTWWVGAALANLGHKEVLDWAPSRRFLLEKMAHRIGGFSKHPGGPPDVYHSCFGLAALAVMGEPGLAEFDSALAVPVATVRVIEKARDALLERVRGKKAGLVKGAVEMGLAMNGSKPAWLGAGEV